MSYNVNGIFDSQGNNSKLGSSSYAEVSVVAASKIAFVENSLGYVHTVPDRFFAPFQKLLRHSVNRN